MVLPNGDELAENLKREGDLGGRTVNHYSKKKEGVKEKKEG